MSKAVKTVVSVVAAIAVPYFAPAIASAIGLSTAVGAAVGSATAGSVIGGAVVGAALGAAKASAFGEDVRTGAILGGVGSGITGYTGGYYGNNPAASASAATSTPQTSMATGADTAYGLTNSTSATSGINPTAPGVGLTMPSSITDTGLSTGFTPVDYSLTAGGQFGQPGLNMTTAGTGFQAPPESFFTSSVDRALAAGTPIDYSLSAGMPTSSTGSGISVVSTAPSGGSQLTTGSGTTALPSGYNTSTFSAPSSTYTQPSSAGGYTQTQPLTAGQQPNPLQAQFLGEGMPSSVDSWNTAYTNAGGTLPPSDSFASKYGKELMNKITSPATLADLTLRAAGMLAGSALAGQGLTDEELQLVEQIKEDLGRQQQENEQLFRERLEHAQGLIGESKYFDPEYFGLQRARRAQNAGARAKRAGLRGLTGDRRTAEGRRYDLATARDTGTAFDQGYLTGVSGRLQTMQAGLNAMPTQFPSNASSYSNLANLYSTGENRRRTTAGDIGDFFGTLTGSNTSRL
jgi:hypothetical protein